MQACRRQRQILFALLRPDQDAVRLFAPSIGIAEPFDRRCLFPDIHFPALLHPEDIDQGNPHRFLQRRHAVRGGMGFFHGVVARAPFPRRDGSERQGEHLALAAPRQQARHRAGTGQPSEKWHQLALPADALVGEDANDPVFAEETADMVEAVPFRKHTRTIRLPFPENSLVEDGVVQRAVESADFHAFGKGPVKAGEEFPVSHVRQQQHHALALCRRRRQQLRVLHLKNLADVLAAHVCRNGRAHQVRHGADERFPRRAFASLRAHRADDPEVPGDRVAPHFHERPDHAPKAFADRKDRLSRQLPEQGGDGRVRPRLHPPLRLFNESGFHPSSAPPAYRG